MTALVDAADESLRVTQEEYRLLLQNDFHSFLHRSFCELNPRTPFLRNWHIEVLAAKLESVRLGKTKRLKGIAPEGDKVMRLHAQTAEIENGFVHLPRGRHDDQVDSTAQALAWFANPGPG